MTVQSTTSRNDYLGNGSTPTYSYSFKIFLSADLLVTVRDADDVETALSINTHYTVSGAGAAAGGSISLVDGDFDWLDDDGNLADDVSLTIRRVPAIKQTADIRNQGSYFPETHENVFDKLVHIMQSLYDTLSRALTLPETIDPDTFDTELPASLVGQAGVSIITNADGDGFIAGPTADEISQAQGYAAAAAASEAAAAAYAAGAAGAGQVVSVITKTISYAVLSTDGLVRGDATAGSITLTLPTAVGNGGKILYLKKIDSSANTVTVDGSGAETIDGALTQVLSFQYQGIAIISNGAGWDIVA